MLPAICVLLTASTSVVFTPIPTIERVWTGSDFYANNLQDWRLRGGAFECIESREQFPARTLQCLTARIKEQPKHYEVSVDFSSYSRGKPGYRGLLIGQGSDTIDHRITALVHNTPGVDGGIFVGTDRADELTIRRFDKAIPGQTWTLRNSFPDEDFPIVDGLEVENLKEGQIGRITVSVTQIQDAYLMEVQAFDLTNDQLLQKADCKLEARDVDGAVALFSHEGGGSRFWNLKMAGEGIRIDHEKEFGPLLAAYYTVSDNILKMTVQGVPLESDQLHYAHLWKKSGSDWTKIDSTYQSRDSLTYSFRVENWDSSRSTEFKVTADVTGVRKQANELVGVIRAEPTGRKSVAAALTCFKSWTGGDEWNANDVWFPHTEIFEGVKWSDPDILIFTGDQIYEGDITPARRDPEFIYLDYLSKYQRFCWSMRDLMKDRPSIIIPDDHDVYQGNLWGVGGNEGKAQTGITKQDTGYTNPATFINAVHRSQTSHLPDPFDPKPVGDLKLSTYTTRLKWGGVDYAILADRQFKSSPTLSVPEGEYRNGFALAKGFDPAANRAEDAELLGDMQERFLLAWGTDWGEDLEQKVVVSQTLLNCLQVRPPNDLSGNGVFDIPFPSNPHEIPPGMVLAVDADSNGWPQTARDGAVRLFSRALALHVNGDQHLASVVQYGTENPRDAGYSFCVPSVANTWPRRWYPPEPGLNRDEGAPPYGGDFKDGFGNWMTVHAVANPFRTGKAPEACHDRVPGWGILKFDNAARTIDLECWPRWSKPSELGAEQFKDWPIRLHQFDQLGKDSGLRLPEMTVRTRKLPVVRVSAEDGDFEYSLRVPNQKFSLAVPRAGNYVVLVQQENGSWLSLGTFTVK